MATTNRAELRRLILKIERDLFAQMHLKALLLNVDAALAEDRQQLRAVKTRIERARDVRHRERRNSDRNLRRNRIVASTATPPAPV